MSNVRAILTRMSAAPRARRASRWTGLLLVLAILLVLPLPFQSYQLNWINLALIAAIGALALNLLMGVAGQVSVGNAAFMAIGATVAGGFAHADPTLSPVIVVLIAATVSALVGAVVGIPALRLRGLYLAVATLALYYIVSYAINQFQTDTVGPAGFYMPIFSLASWSVGMTQRGWYYLLLVVVLATFFFVRQLTERTRFGRAWHLLNGHPKAASVMGIDVPRATVQAFVISSFLIGLQGGLYAYYLGVLDSGDFTLALSIQYVAMIVIGGWGSMTGAVAGAVIVTLLPLGVQSFGSALPQNGSVGQFINANIPSLQTLVYGLLIVLFLMFEPGGLAHLAKVCGAWSRRLLLGQSGTNTVAGSEMPPAAAEVVQVLEQRPSDPGPTDPEGASGPSFEADGASVPLLVIDRLGIAYPGGIAGTHSVSFSVIADEITLLLGANGAGKTSTLRAITGFSRGEAGKIATGTVLLNGRDVTGNAPDAMVDLGVALVPEGHKVFMNMTVQENLQLSVQQGRRRGGAGISEADEMVRDLFPALSAMLDRKAGALSGGERQMLAIARALLLRPKLLVVDELSLGLAPVIVDDLLDHLQQINAQHDLTILMAEQSSVATEIAHRAVVIETGITRWEGRPEDLSANQALTESYLGTDVANA